MHSSPPLPKPHMPFDVAQSRAENTLTVLLASCTSGRIASSSQNARSDACLKRMFDAVKPHFVEPFLSFAR